MPIPRIDLRTGKSQSGIAPPNSSSDKIAINARILTDDLHSTHVAPSRGNGDDVRMHSAPQTLQRNFPESENVKSSPPVTIVNDIDDSPIDHLNRGCFQLGQALVERENCFRPSHLGAVALDLPDVLVRNRKI